MLAWTCLGLWYMYNMLRTIKRRGEYVRSRGVTLMTRQVPAEVVAGALLEFVIIPYLRRGIKVQETLTLRGVQHLKKVDPSQRRAIEVMCNIPERNVARVA